MVRWVFDDQSPTVVRVAHRYNPISTLGIGPWLPKRKTYWTGSNIEYSHPKSDTSAPRIGIGQPVVVRGTVTVALAHVVVVVVVVVHLQMYQHNNLLRLRLRLRVLHRQHRVDALDHIPHSPDYCWAS